MTLRFNSYYSTAKSGQIVGYIDPLFRLNIEPFCEIVADQYKTGSTIFPSVGISEEFLLKDLVKGFNLSFGINHTLENNYQFTPLNSLIKLDSALYEDGTLNILGTSQLVDSNGLSVLARLGMKRTALGEKYFVYFGLHKEVLLPDDFYSIPIEEDDNIRCFDLALTQAEQVVVYCVETKKQLTLTKYFDYFLVLNANLGDKKYFKLEAGSFDLPGNILAGKVLAYKSIDK